MLALISSKDYFIADAKHTPQTFTLKLRDKSS